MQVTLSTRGQRLTIQNSSRSCLTSLVSSVSSITGTQFCQLQEPSFSSFADYRKPVSSVLFRPFRFVDYKKPVSSVSFRQSRFVDYKKPVSFRQLRFVSSITEKPLINALNKYKKSSSIYVNTFIFLCYTICLQLQVVNVHL